MNNKYLIISMACLFLLVLGDCWSTYLCLTTPSEVYQVWEYNPVSDWMFREFGLLTGLLIFSAVKGLGLLYLYSLASRSFLAHKVVSITTVVAILVTAYVNINNWNIYLLLKEGV